MSYKFVCCVCGRFFERKNFQHIQNFMTMQCGRLKCKTVKIIEHITKMRKGVHPKQLLSKELNEAFNEIWSYIVNEIEQGLKRKNLINRISIVENLLKQNNILKEKHDK